MRPCLSLRLIITTQALNRGNVRSGNCNPEADADAPEYVPHVLERLGPDGQSQVSADGSGPLDAPQWLATGCADPPAPACTRLHPPVPGATRDHQGAALGCCSFLPTTASPKPSALTPRARLTAPVRWESGQCTAADAARLYASVSESLCRSRLNSAGSPPPLDGCGGAGGGADADGDAPRGAAAALEDALREAGIRGSIRDQAKAVSRRPSMRVHHRDGAAEKHHHGRHHHHHDTGAMRVASVGGAQRKERESRASLNHSLRRGLNFLTRFEVTADI